MVEEVGESKLFSNKLPLPKLSSSKFLPHKLPPYRIFTVFSLAFLIGVFLVSYSTFSFNLIVFFIIICSLLFAGLVNFYLKNYWLYFASFAILFLFAGASYYIFFDRNNKMSLPYGETLSLEGKIIKKPDVDYKRQQVTIQITKSDKQEIEGAQFLVKLPHYPAVYYGNTIKFSGKIEKPGIISDFDYGRYLKRYQIFGTVSAPADITMINKNLSIQDKIVKSIYNIPMRSEEALNKVLPEPQASLAAGIILGVKRNIPEDFKDSLSKTGLTHIIALSGYNITIIVWVLSSILLGYINRKKVFLISLILIIIFVFMTGVSSSALRAAIFSMLIIFGRTIGRRGDFTNLMLLAAVIMIAVNPYVLANDIGFQLSFAAFAGLVYLTPVFKKILARSKLQTLPFGIFNSFIETVSAQTAVMPLLLTVFGTISFVAPLANLLIVWIVPYAMAASFISAISQMIFEPLGKLTIVLTWPILTYITSLTNWLAKIPFASFDTKAGMTILPVILYLIFSAVAFYYNKKYKLKII